MKTIKLILSIYFLSSLIFIENGYCQYPFHPTNTQHKIAGTIGEERGGRNRFHYGLDFPNPVGTDVYSIESGPLRKKADGSFAIGRFGYIHVDQNSYIKGLVSGNVVPAGVLIGTLQKLKVPGSEHVHLQEATTNIYSLTNSGPNFAWEDQTFNWINPILSRQPVDNVTPMIDKIKFYRQGDSVVMTDLKTVGKLYGKYDIMVETKDSRILSNGSGQSVGGVAPLKIQYKVVDNSNNILLDWSGIDFSNVPPNSSAKSIFGINSNYLTPKFEYIITNHPFIKPYNRSLNYREHELYGVTTNWPLSAKYKDGTKLIMFVRSCDESNNCDSEVLLPIPSSSYEVDNFQPYIAKVNVKFANRELYTLNRLEASLNNENTGFLKNKITKRSFIPSPGAEVVLTVNTSEILSELKIGYNLNSEGIPSNYYNMDQSMNNKLVWTYKFRPPLLKNNDFYFFTFKGKDISTNEIIDVYWSSLQNGSGSVPIPCRINHTGTQWANVPAIAPGKDHVKVPFNACGRSMIDDENCNILENLENSIIYNSCNDAVVSIYGTDFDATNYLISWTDENGISLPLFNDRDRINVINAGTYCYKIETINDCCTTEGCVEVINEQMINASFELTAEITHVCSEVSTSGSVDLNIEGDNGPYKVDWYAQMPPDLDALVQSQTNVVNGSGLEDLNGYKRGTYLVHVIDQNGCSQTATYVIENNGISISEPSPIVICQPSTGEITPVVSGGSGSYSFEWSNGESDEEQYGLEPGTYTVTITDDGGCSAVKSYVLTSTTSPISFAENFETVPPTTCSSSDGYIKTWRIGNIVGGVYPMTYLWSNGATTNTIGPIPAGFYTLTVTSADGCTAVKEQELRAVEQINITTEQIINPCPGESYGYIAISADQEAIYECEALNITGDSEYFFELTDLPSGTYCIKITSLESECEIEKCYTIVDEMSDGPLMLNGRIRKSCKGENNGGVILTVTGGHSRLGYDVAWDKPQGPPGTYTVVVTDHCGGTATATFDVGEFDYEPILITAVYPGNDIIHTITGGSGSFTYRWEYEQYPNYWRYNANSQKDSPQPSANRYRFTVVDIVTGCSRQVIYECFVYSPIITHTCPGWNAGTITLSKLYGRGDHTFVWSNGATTKDIVDLVAGIYTVTITSSLGCETSLSFEVLETAIETSTPEFTIDTGCGWRKKCNGNGREKFVEFDNNNPIHTNNGQLQYIEKNIGCNERDIYCPTTKTTIRKTIPYIYVANWDLCVMNEHCPNDINSYKTFELGVRKKVYQLTDNECKIYTQCILHDPETAKVIDVPQSIVVEYVTASSNNRCCPESVTATDVASGSNSTTLTIEYDEENSVDAIIRISGPVKAADGTTSIQVVRTLSTRITGGIIVINLGGLPAEDYTVDIDLPELCNDLTTTFKIKETIPVKCPEFQGVNPKFGFPKDNVDFLFSAPVAINGCRIEIYSGTFVSTSEPGTLEKSHPFNLSLGNNSIRVLMPDKEGFLTIKIVVPGCDDFWGKWGPFTNIKDDNPISAFKGNCDDNIISINYDSIKQSYLGFYFDNDNSNTLKGLKFSKLDYNSDVTPYSNLTLDHHQIIDVKTDIADNHYILKNSISGLNQYQKIDVNSNINWAIDLPKLQTKAISKSQSGNHDIIAYDSLLLKYIVLPVTQDGNTGPTTILPLENIPYALIHQSGQTSIGLEADGSLTFAGLSGLKYANVPSGVTIKDINTLSNGNIVMAGEFKGIVHTSSKSYNSGEYKNAIFLTYDAAGNFLSSQSVQNYRDETVNGIATKGSEELAYHGRYTEVVYYDIDTTLNEIDSCIFVNIVPLGGGGCEISDVVLTLDEVDCILSWGNPSQDSVVINLQQMVDSVWITVPNASSPFTPTNDGSYRLVLSKAGCSDFISDVVDVECSEVEACNEDPIDITYSETENKFLYFYKTNGTGQLVKSEWISPVTYMMVDSFITWSCENITIKDIIVDENLNVYVIGCDPTVTNKTRIIKYNWTTKQIIWSQWREKFVYYSTVPYATNGGTSLNIAGYDTYLQRWYIYGYNRSNGSGTTSQQVNYNFSKGTYEGMRYYKENVFTYYSFGSTGTTISFKGTTGTWQQTLSPLVTVREVTILHNEHTVVGGDFTGTFTLDGVVYEAYPYRSVIFIEYDVLGNVLNVKIYKGSKHFVLKSFTTDGYYKFAYTGYTTENLNIGENVLLDLELLANHPDACAHVDGGSLSIAQLRNAIEVHPESVVKFYPNPFTKGINLDIESPQKDVVSIVVINSIGSVMFTTKVDVEAGQNVKYLNEFEQLPSGVYTVKLKSDLMDHTTRVIRIE